MFFGSTLERLSVAYHWGWTKKKQREKTLRFESLQTNFRLFFESAINPKRIFYSGDEDFA
jgi:hypothetical protein